MIVVHFHHQPRICSALTAIWPCDDDGADCFNLVINYYYDCCYELFLMTAVKNICYM